ncbi:MAG TPA: hypothetical protein DCG30_07135 [Ruminococcus sp.]|nr:hypothetical protein [Ruminococcus sp.]
MNINPDIIKNADNPEELADLIDALMAQGSGHVNIQSGNGSVTVNTVRSTDCSGIKGACCQPTENAVDDDED